MSSPPTSGNPFPLLRLPLELRHEIYGWVQGEQNIKIHAPFSYKFAGNILLHVNKQVSDEYINFIIKTSEIQLDFGSHRPIPRESEILQRAHKLDIHDKIIPFSEPPGFYPSGGTGYISLRPGSDLKPWVNELILNPAIAHLSVTIRQRVLFQCYKHMEGEDCDHVKLFRMASRPLREVRVCGSARVIWTDPRGCMASRISGVGRKSWRSWKGSSRMGSKGQRKALRLLRKSMG